MKKLITLIFAGVLLPLLSLAHTGTPGIEDGSVDHHEMMDVMSGNVDGGGMMNWMWGGGFIWWFLGILVIIWIIAGITWIYFMFWQMKNMYEEEEE